MTDTTATTAIGTAQHEEKTLDDLRSFMGTSKTINEWNVLREEAKSIFPIEMIRTLEGTGFVNRVLKRPPNVKKLFRLNRS